MGPFYAVFQPTMADCMFFINIKKIKISSETIFRQIAKIDIDKDGYISVYELLTCIKSAIQDIRGKK